MSIKEIFFKELDRPINGVVKADQADDATVHQELDEYVVTNELENTSVASSSPTVPTSVIPPSPTEWAYGSAASLAQVSRTS